MNHINIIQEHIKSKYPGASFHIHEYKDLLRLDTLWIPKNLQRKGIGTEIMNFLSSYADKNNITITLTPVKRELYKFYEKFNFIRTANFNDSMIRLPKVYKL